MRALFTAPGGVGHLHPLLPLAAAMTARGHDVRLASDAGNCTAAARTGLATVTAGLSGSQRRELSAQLFGVDADAAPPRQRSDVMVPYAFGGAAAPVMAEELRRLVAEWRPDLVVHDQLELAAPLVAAELGVHHVARSFGSTVPVHRLDAAATVLGPLWEQAGFAIPPMCGVFDDVYVDMRPPSLPGHPPAGTRVLVERPTPADAVGGELPAIVTSRTDTPLVYVTLGTVFADASVLRTAVSGLADLDVRVVVTLGPRGDTTAFGAVAPTMHVTRYVPQPTLLPHCDVVVCHGGSGTYLGALANGIPLLCLPQAADQFVNADAIVAAGAGLSLEGSAVTADAVRDGVMSLLGTRSYRSAARRIAQEIAAMPSPEEVAIALESVAAC